MATDYSLDFYVIPDVTWDRTLEAAKNLCSVHYLGERSKFNLPGPHVKSSIGMDLKPGKIRQQPFEYDGLYLLRKDFDKPSSFEEYAEQAQLFMQKRGRSISKEQLLKNYQEEMNGPDNLQLLLYQTNNRKCSWLAGIDNPSSADAIMFIYALCVELGLDYKSTIDETTISYSMAWHYDNSNFKGDFQEYMQQAKDSGLIGDEELDELYLGDAAEHYKKEYDIISKHLDDDGDDDYGDDDDYDTYGDDDDYDDWDIKETKITPNDIARLITEDPDISSDEDELSIDN